MLKADVKAIDKTTRIRTLNIITGLQEGTRHALLGIKDLYLIL
jgi:hypothetical protein